MLQHAGFKQPFSGLFGGDVIDVVHALMNSVELTFSDWSRRADAWRQMSAVEAALSSSVFFDVAKNKPAYVSDTVNMRKELAKLSAGVPSNTCIDSFLKMTEYDYGN